MKPDPAAMSIAQADAYVEAAEALADVARAMVEAADDAVVLDQLEALADALANFEAIKATAERSEPENGVSPHAGTASGFDQSAAAPFEHRSPSVARTD